MERSLAGVLFLVAGVAFSLAGGGWWMQRIVFTPDDTRDAAAAMLQEADVRVELNTVISSSVSNPMETAAGEVAARLERDVLTTRAGAAVMAPLMRQAHERIIGLRDDDVVRMTGIELIPIVRDERAAELDQVTFPIEPIGVLSTTRSIVGWMIRITAGLGLVALALGGFTRPDRRDIIRGIGEFGLALAGSMLVFGYLVPAQFLTAIDNRTWTHTIPRLAERTLPVVLGTSAIFAIGGGLLILASKTTGKRRQWSTPLSVARYQGGDNPGWR